MKIAFLTILILVASASPAFAQQQNTASAPMSLELALPPAIYAVPDVPVGFYYANIVNTNNIYGLKFTVGCPIGKDDGKRWLLNATDQDVGKHPLSVIVKNSQGQLVAEAKTSLCVVPRDAGKQRQIRILIVGDSLTGKGGGYPSVMAQLLAKPGNPEWSMLGTRNSPELPTIRTEGYPGWKWEDFLTRYEAKPDPKNKKESSPFVFAGENGTPGLDVARYMHEQCNGQAPDIVTFLLGINDASRVYNGSEAGQNRKILDQGIDGILKNADALLNAVHAAMPKTALAICIIPPANSRDAAFATNYQNSRTPSGWKLIQHRMVQRMIEHFKNREKENVFLVPTELFLDIEAGFPDNNAVHPNTTGHEQIGAALYSWMKWWLAEGKSNP